MEDVLALYERPLDPREPVVCLDERPLLLHADVRAPRPARPGHVAKRDHEYRRCGTANLFGIVEPKVGRHLSRVTPDRTGVQFARVIRKVIAAYPRARSTSCSTTSTSITKAPWCEPSAPARLTGSGVDSPSTTRRSMGAGSTRPSSSSVSSAAKPWAAPACRRAGAWGRASARGISAPIAARHASTGASRAKRPHQVQVSPA